MSNYNEHPSLGQQLQATNEVIAYIDGLAIISDEWDRLFFCELPPNAVAIGNVVETQYLQPIKILASEIQEKILKEVRE